MSRRLSEGLKTLILVLLLLSAGGLCWFNWFLGMEDPIGDSDDPLPQVAAVQPAAWPSAAGVFWDGGGYGALYHSGGVSLILDLWGDLLGECLSTAGPPAEKTPEDWCAVLHGSGVYVSYEAGIPVSALTLWQGYAPSEGVDALTARQVFLAAGTDGFTLWLRDGSAVWCCETASGHSDLDRLSSELLDNGAEFTFVSGREQLLLPGEVVRPALESVPFSWEEAALNALVRPFHLSAYAGNRYTGQDGTLVFVEGSRTLRLEPGGWGVYQDRDSNNSDEPLLLPVEQNASPAERIEAARTLSKEILGTLPGDAELALASYEEGSETVIRFQALVDGVPLRMSLPAFELRVKNGVVTDALFCLQGVRRLESTCRALPSLQAAAAAQERITLGYLYDAGVWTLGWTEE